MPRIRSTLVLTLTLLACGRAEKPAAPAQQSAAERSDRLQPVDAPPKPAATSTDAHAAEVEAAQTMLDDWHGEPGRLEAAKEKFTAMLAQDRNYAPAYAGLARVEYLAGYLRGDSFETAALNRAWKLVQHALKLDPNVFEAHIAAGYISRFQGDLDLARASFDRAEEIRPGHEKVLLGRAEIADAENDAATMLALAKKVIAESAIPTHQANAYTYVIEAYGRGGHADQVDAAYREQIKLRPDVAWYHGNYAGFLLRRGDVDGAVREAEAAVRISPYPIAVNTLARALLAKANKQWESGEFAAAGKTVERIATLGGDDPLVYAGIGGFYEAASIRTRDAAMRSRALEWYRKALALVPEDRELQETVERLDRRTE